MTTATGNPRMRTAGNPTTTPTTIAPSAASSGASGNGIEVWMMGICQLAVRGPSRNPATPASVSWAREIWPA